MQGQAYHCDVLSGAQCCGGFNVGGKLPTSVYGPFHEGARIIMYFRSWAGRGVNMPSVLQHDLCGCWYENGQPRGTLPSSSTNRFKSEHRAVEQRDLPTAWINPHCRVGIESVRQQCRLAGADIQQRLPRPFRGWCGVQPHLWWCVTSHRRLIGNQLRNQQPARYDGGARRLR